MKIEDYHSAHVARINRRDARIAVAVLVVIVALTIAGWLHTLLVTRPMCDAILAQQASDLARADDLLAQASEMMEEVSDD